MDVPVLGTQSQSTTEGPFIRLLVCSQCKTIDELPDYEGDPRRDTILQVAIDQNHTDSVTQQAHVGNLLKVSVKHWTRPEVKKEIIKQIQTGSKGLAEIDDEIYESRSTFFDDAMKCFNQHQRPKGQCPDYKSDKKRLVPNTNAERKELGFAKASETGPKVHLCDFCPVKTYNVTRERMAAGAYK